MKTRQKIAKEGEIEEKKLKTISLVKVLFVL